MSSSESMSDSHFERWRIVLGLSLLFMVMIISFYASKIVHKFKLHIFTESGIIMLLGIIVGTINYFTGNELHVDFLFPFNTFIFDFFILPSIIFESGYTLRKKGLFRNFFTIFLLAVVGTIFNTLFVGLLCYVFNVFVGIDGLDTSKPVEALLFGSIISAVDPVATLSILSNVLELSKRPYVPLVFNLVFGESVINDAVAIVLFRIFVDFVPKEFTWYSSLQMLGMFFYVSLGSVLIGLIVGFISAILFKYVSLKQHHSMELLTIILIAFISYLLAEAATLSGILSLFSCSVIMGRFTWYNLSEYSKLATPQTFKALSTFADNYVFFYLGLSVFSVADAGSWKLGFIGLALGLCLVSRMIFVFPMSFIANFWRTEKIKLSEMVIIWVSGLRGAISFALALETLNLSTPNGKVIVTTTLAIILFMVWIGGGITYPLLKILKLLDDPENIDDNENPTAILLIQKANYQPRGRGIIGNEKMDSLLNMVDSKFFTPIFRKRLDHSSTLLRDLLISGAVPERLRIAEVDFASDDMENVRKLAKSKEEKVSIRNILKKKPTHVRVEENADDTSSFENHHPSENQKMQDDEKSIDIQTDKEMDIATSNESLNQINFDEGRNINIEE